LAQKNSIQDKNFTSEDVAALAKVSQSTVSRVFAGTANVSKQKKERILAAAEKLGYRPNAHARSLITKKTRMIGIVMRNIRNPFYSAVLEIFYNRLSNLGYHLLFINSENEEIQDTEVAQLLEYNVEGVIITDALLSSSAAQKFDRSKIAVILFNRYTERLTTSAVFCDNYLAVKQIAAYLVDLGHRNFAFIAGPSDTSTTIDRLKGFHEVLKERNIKNLVIESGNYTYESGFVAAKNLFEKNKNIDCVFCANDIIALGAMDALRQMNIRIPDDVSVFGFDNIRMAAWPTYSLTTWEQPIEEMITSTVEILLKEINNKNTKPQIIMAKGQLILRNSVKAKM
jgi:DNA-binding LacI/PurR family transcriptional regulator